MLNDVVVSRSLLGMWFHLLEFFARKKFSLALGENHTSPNDAGFEERYKTHMHLVIYR